ncbi:MAG: type VI secretion system tube protein Hcp [Rhodospirillales bacterium]
MAIFMLFGSIAGDVATEGFETWTELQSFQWGVGRGVGSAMSGAMSREASVPSISEIVVTKRMDAASPALWTDSVAGMFNTAVTITFTTTSQGATEKFLSYELTDCGLSGYSVSSGGDMPQESLSLNFAKISWTLTPVKSDGSGTPVTQGYDLTLSKTT